MKTLHLGPAVSALGALDVVLTAEDLAAIEAAAPRGAAAGERYPEAVRQYMDSER